MNTTIKATRGLMVSFIPIIIAFIVTYPTLTESEVSLAMDPALQGTTFVAPLNMSKAKVATKFGPRVHPTTGKRIVHTGLDLASKQGEPVVAASAGTIVKAVTEKERGNYIVIRHNNTYSSSYSHLSGLVVKAGQVVEAGALIGYVGTTGVSSGPHLHFEVLKDGKAVDPVGYLPMRKK